ncbi:hypothetical protein F511_25700 [Dorcoceras hygrometricum]|uniref:Uncharacterized protein n=1 Tax=Dorcoceras hygrometricum TaxID=472368 RepID=A0A2Z7ALF8_9LAMI|nr:hypothetical protein F511_25700 [Dorcoceras hygrometricum]
MHDPLNNMSRAMYTGSIDVHPLLMEGPNQTLEEIQTSRHDIVGDSPEQRPAGGATTKLTRAAARDVAPSASHGRASSGAQPLQRAIALRTSVGHQAIKGYSYPQPLRLRNHNSGPAQRIMVKRLATSPHDPLGITDSACKNQSVVVSIQYGPFNPYIPIRSKTIGKSRVAIDLIAMRTSWRSNSDIASVTSIGYPRMSASGESSTTMHRLLHASGSHPIPTPYDSRTNQYNQDLGLIHSTNVNHLESPNEGSSIDHQRRVLETPVGARHKCQRAPTPVAPAEQPSMPKRTTQKRKRKLILNSDDDIVDSEPVVGGSIVGEEDVKIVDDTAEKAVEPVVESVEEQQAETTVGISEAETAVDNVDDVDVIIEQVIAETAQLETDEGEHVDEPDVSRATFEDQAVEKADEVERWFDLPYEVLIAGNTEQMVTTASDTDEEFIANQVFGIECPLPSAYVEITKIILGKTISIPGVNEGDWYKASLPKIPTADKGKAPLLERDPVKGNPIKEQFSLILADIEVLVMLREKIIEDVDRFFNSFSLKRLATLKIDESYFDKEALILSWAETDSTRVALNRRTYILTKYRELLIRKFLEARKINFTPGEGSSATNLKVMEMLSDLHLFVVDDLKKQTMAHGLKCRLLRTIEQKSRADTEVEVVVEAIGVDLPREDIPAVVVDHSEDRLKIG